MSDVLQANQEFLATISLKRNCTISSLGKKLPAYHERLSTLVTEATSAVSVVLLRAARLCFIECNIHVHQWKGGLQWNHSNPDTLGGPQAVS